MQLPPLDVSSCVVCASGGLDSTVLLAYLRHRDVAVRALNISYGSRHNASERACARAFATSHQIPYDEVDLDFVPALYRSKLLAGQGSLPEGHYSDHSMQQTVVPGRNTLLLAIALGVAESHGLDAVALANHRDDHAMYPDTTPEWVEAMRQVAYHGTYRRIRLLAPMTEWSKAEICRLGVSLGVDLAATWTCYAGGSVHCGRCGACSSRREAFRRAAVSDPTRYASP